MLLQYDIIRQTIYEKYSITLAEQIHLVGS